jgi:hypothetical protein
MDVVARDRLREGELSRKDGRDSNLVGLEIDIWRDNGSGGEVDSFTLSIRRKRMSPKPRQTDELQDE